MVFATLPAVPRVARHTNCRHALLYSTASFCWSSRRVATAGFSPKVSYMPDLTGKSNRPLWYNLSPFNLPLPGLVSIFHRISGILLFLGLAWLLFLLDLSLSSEAGFEKFRGYVAHPLVKIALLALLWSYLHHFCAGIRYLFLDIHKGVDLATARATSWAVFGVSLVLTLLIGARLW